jgi:hypothetical protein
MEFFFFSTTFLNIFSIFWRATKFGALLSGERFYFKKGGKEKFPNCLKIG